MRSISTSFFHFAILCLTAIPVSVAQDLNYARSIIDTLCAPAYHGRGYVNNGDSKAAEFIRKEFTKFRLDSLSPDYFQAFTTPANTFPGDLTVKVNHEALVPGQDYLVSPASRGINGKFGIMIIENNDLLDVPKLKTILVKASGKFIVLPPIDKAEFNSEQVKSINEIRQALQAQNDLPFAGLIILTDQKLTWSAAPYQNPRPTIEVKSEIWPKKVKQLEVSIDSRFISQHHSQNVIGKIEGLNHDSIIVITAHYDHLGRMGRDTYFPGANDNASGVAMLLNLAQYYTEHTPQYDMVFMAFGGEEIGLVGSRYFVDNPLFPLEKIKFLINLDISGTGDDGIQVVNGKKYKPEFDLLQKINQEDSLLQAVKIRGEACNSDHCFFDKVGVPCFFIYTLGGIQAYHDIYDKAETLPLTEFEDYFKLLVKFIQEL